MRTVIYAWVIALAAFWTPATEAQQTGMPVNGGDEVTVRLSNFAFAPEHLRLKAGVPVRLRLVNESSGGHDFSAPAFFAAGSFPSVSPVPRDGGVAVASHQTVELTIVPRTPGSYRLECTHFLHSMFGMHGTIEVVP
jgi:uncharacterized cupredoxin-like copper-binding protein